MRGRAEFVAGVEALMDPSLARINDEAIAALSVESVGRGARDPGAPAAARTETDVIRFALALNAINHQFWEIRDGRFERYARGGAVGAMAMRAALSEMLEDAGSFEALSRRLPLSASDIRRWFGPISDPEGRAEALSQALGEQGEAAAALLAKSAKEEGAWGVESARSIAALLPLGFEDPFLKKAQLCLWMAKGMLEARGWSAPEAEVTAFADYQVPKALRGLGVLEYSDELARKIEEGELLEADGPMETAIRAATVVACERVAKAKGISAPELDFWLWSKRNDFNAPFHLTRTARY